MTRVDALSGPEALQRFMSDYVCSSDGTLIWQGIGEWCDQRVVIMRVADGPFTAMWPDQARGMAAFCLAADGMPRLVRECAAKLAELARHLIELADECDAMHRRRLH